MNDPRTITERLAALGIDHEPTKRYGARLLVDARTREPIAVMTAEEAVEFLRWSDADLLAQARAVLDDHVETHRFLCHPGRECEDGCDVPADPQQLAAYHAASDDAELRSLGCEVRDGDAA